MTTTQQKELDLTATPDTVTRPEMHYVFIEKTGPFMTTAPQAWGEVHPLTAAISEHNRITGYCSLYKMGPQVYRAGVCVAEEPEQLPAGLTYEKVAGGRYVRFILKGSYAGLPEATRRSFEVISEKKIALRDGFNVENYVDDPRVIPEDELNTEILFPAP